MICWCLIETQSYRLIVIRKKHFNTESDAYEIETLTGPRLTDVNRDWDPATRSLKTDCVVPQ